MSLYEGKMKCLLFVVREKKKKKTDFAFKLFTNQPRRLLQFPTPDRFLSDPKRVN